MRTLAGALALALIIVGILRAEVAFFAAALPPLMFLAMGLLAGAPQFSLEATRTVSSRFVPAGTRVEIKVHIQCTGRRIESLSLDDPLPGSVRVVEGCARWQGSLDAGGSVTLQYVLEAERGLLSFEGIAAEAVDPFTSMKSSARLPCPSSIAVYPRSFLAPDTSFGAHSARPFSGLSRTKRTGSGTDFSGTRDYTPGDPLRHLNWRAEALWGRPIVNVFEEERAIDAGIILDCRSEAYVEQELFEEAAAAALTLAEDLLDRGHRIAFLNYGSLISWTPPGSGREHGLRIRMAAARAELGNHAAFDRFDNLPIRLFPPRSLVLMVSPLQRQDVPPLRSLKALGYEIAVLRPNPLSRIDETKPDSTWKLTRRILELESEVLLSRLLRSGIAVLDWNTAQPLATLRAHGSGRP
jgi:uncharacterized protein (DUF58 family)